MVHFKSQPVASAPAPAQSMAGTCQGCTAVKEAVVSLQKQIREKDLASAKGSTKANSAASTQDHSGDTLDDMSVFCDLCCPSVVCSIVHTDVTLTTCHVEWPRPLHTGSL